MYRIAIIQGNFSIGCLISDETRGYANSTEAEKIVETIVISLGFEGKIAR